MGKNSNEETKSESESEEEFLVDKILRRRKTKVGYKYLVKWQGFEDETWEPEKNLVDTVAFESFMNELTKSSKRGKRKREKTSEKESPRKKRKIGEKKVKTK